MNRAQLEKRIAELQTEYEAGQAMLANLDTRRAELQQTMLRISGAIEVLKELLTESDGSVEKG